MIYYGEYCKKCGNEIIVDDVDFNFRGCQDEYLICENCKAYIHVKVRYNKICKIEYGKYEPYEEDYND